LLSAKGSWRQRAGQPPIGPNGLDKSFKNLRAGVLLGRVGPHGARFVVGELHRLEAAEDGKLFLAINDIATARLVHFPMGIDRVAPRADPPIVPLGAAEAIEVTVSASAAFQQRHKQPDGRPGPPFRLLTTLKGHRHEVICVAFSPDGTRLASGSCDFTARLWDTATWQVLRTLPGHQDTIESVAFSPDGARLLTGSRDKSLMLWDVATGVRLKSLLGHGDHVLSVAFFPDGKRAASTGDDQTVRIWDLARGQWTRTLPCEAASWSVAVSPDGRLVAMAGSEGPVRVWDAKTGRIKQAFFAQIYNSWSLAFSPDGQRLATASFDRTIKVWTLEPEAAREAKPPAPERKPPAPKAQDPPAPEPKPPAAREAAARKAWKNIQAHAKGQLIPSRAKWVLGFIDQFDQEWRDTKIHAQVRQEWTELRQQVLEAVERGAAVERDWGKTVDGLRCSLVLEARELRVGHACVFDVVENVSEKAATCTSRLCTRHSSSRSSARMAAWSGYGRCASTSRRTPESTSASSSPENGSRRRSKAAYRASGRRRPTCPPTRPSANCSSISGTTPTRSAEKAGSGHTSTPSPMRRPPRRASATASSRCGQARWTPTPSPSLCSG
ncbi:WD40 repeat domain-containing protein, partial [bacterium]|nr:WD40 repeat domain-containing protein [bacterium]